jgi:uncharacterized membrane protein
VLLGVAVWAALSALAVPFRLVAAGDGFFCAYLATAALFMVRTTPAAIRRRARYADEGIIIIVLITLGAVVLSLWSMFALLGGSAQPGAARFALTIASVVLGWLTLHTVFGVHYAHLYYARASEGVDRQDAAGLDFPKTKEPVLSDFLYFAFVIGMTAQVSDVPVLTASLRRLILFHGVVSFFFNTVLLALAINLAAGAVH